MPFLGEVPLHMDIRETSDTGRPITVTDPDSPHAAAYRSIAGKVWEQVGGGPVRVAPKIVIES